jgi:hypothetical protein
LFLAAGPLVLLIAAAFAHALSGRTVGSSRAQ